MTPLEAALSYAKRGWPVFPCFTPRPDGTCDCGSAKCESIGKHPRTRNGLKNATTDAAQITKWWSADPHANVGIRTGEIAPGRYLSVVDLDLEKGGAEALAALTATHGVLPKTAEARSGGGGSHWFFEGPAPVKTTSKRLGPGLDTRGGGGKYGEGYVIAAPSLHRSGRRYEWVEMGTAAEPPAWVVLLANGPEPTTASTPIDGKPPPATTEERIPNGARKKTLHSIGRTMRARGLNADEIFAALSQVNLRCETPLDEKDVRRMADQAAKVPPGRSPEFERGDREPGDDDAPRLKRGDEVELATLLLEDLGGDVLHDRGELWRYATADGVFQRIPQHEARRVTAGYAGLPVMGKPLRLSSGQVKGAVSLAESFSSREGFFDSAPRGIAFRNGFVVVEGGVTTLLPHSADRRAHHQLPFDFDPEAKAPRWEQYLDEVFSKPGEIETDDDARDRRDKIALLQEFVGACLLGTVTQFAVCLVLTGEGANGKSVFLQVIKALFPPGATVSLAPQLWENRFYLAELSGIRLNAVSELPERDILESDAFKAVVAGDPVMVARKHQRPFTLRPSAGHIFAANALPSTRDQSEGFWRRFVVVPFERRFAEGERDLTLAVRLIETELSGIVAWAIEGARRLQLSQRFTSPLSSRDAKSEWQHDSDQVRQFVEECCEVDATAETTLTAIYPAFALWAKRTGHGGLSRNRLGNRLRQLGHFTRSRLGRFYRLTVRADVRAEVARSRRYDNSTGYA